MIAKGSVNAQREPLVTLRVIGPAGVADVAILLGMRLLEGCELRMAVQTDGIVEIHRLS